MTDVEGTGLGAGGGESRCRRHLTPNFRLSLALWSISPNHVAMKKQGNFLGKATMSFIRD